MLCRCLRQGQAITPRPAFSHSILENMTQRMSSISISGPKVSALKPATTIIPFRGFSQTAVFRGPEASIPNQNTQVETSVTAVPPPPTPAHAIPDSFAIIHVAGTQYKVTQGDVIVTNRINGPDIGQHLILDKVLLIGTKDMTAIGQPLLENAGVHVVVEEHTRTEKVLVFKKKRRKNYRRLNGHRQDVTSLRVHHISFDQTSK